MRAQRTGTESDSVQRHRSIWSIQSLIAEVSECENWGSPATVFYHGILLSLVYELVLVMSCLALAESSPTLVLVIVQSTCAFVVLLSACVYCRLPSPLPMMSVFVTICGIVVVGLASEHHSAHAGRTTLSGVLCCIACAASFGTFEVLWAEWIGSGGKVRFESVLTMLGLMGVFTIVLLWPTLWLFEGLGNLGVSLVGVPSKFEWPPDWPSWLISISIASTSLVYDLCLMGGTSLTSALYMSVGSVLCIPTSTITDWVLRGSVLNWGQTCGTSLILAGFFIFILHEKCAEEQNSRQLQTLCVNSNDGTSLQQLASNQFS
eukprot:gnl/MRDRNA2_/MRDRNA2_115751_c0_seq1.p1 gnl/MRDRNA2_/MRDRNA2_115751_c0~~gnl/MRDRNA2_/MRDRNA2_115751_c0_seq1.p1  ORF type:complete len:344 (+),score=20.59 gnl/MRDRNA2_/MRDRNA2_115751_c0_seq1:77-1033(+)